MRASGIGGGIALAIASSATFGTAGTLAHALLAVGWSPAAAVTMRISIAAIVLTVPALVAARGRWADIRSAAVTMAGFGLVAVALCQLCYFNAVSRMSVSIALLIEYLGIVLVVGWLWARHGQRPRRLTFGGTGLAVAGLALVLDVFGAHTIDPLGVLWALAAAAGLAIYFVVGSSGAERLPPLIMAWGGMVVGAITMWVLAGVGAVSVHMSTTPVTIASHRMSWIVPVLGLSLLAAAFAYVAGIAAARRLGAKLASFVSLTEVLFAALFAWLLLGQTLTGVQLSGGLLVIAGVALVRLDEFRAPTHRALDTSDVLGASDASSVTGGEPLPRTPRPASAVPSLASTADLTRGS